ncbi:MAG TPA: aminotransferase class I/II-fold pyridoxal phosphate-dependent enzyme [Bryobacteraceae bacterium]|nr:aminotransferase class I/II-fold pyridoxal phosphate-dependent enzyme [Bryobacteraceae bacterium]
MNLHTKAVHAGDRKRTGSWVPVTTPIHTATSFFYDDVLDLDRSFEGTLAGPSYARHGNPTNEALEELVTSLEGGAGALACASGMAALNMAIMAALVDRRRVLLAANALYGATINMLMKVLEPCGVETVFVDFSDEAALEAAIQEHRPGALLMETISNPILRVPPLDRVAGLANQGGAQLVVDSTFSTPMITRPLEFGAHFVVHSLTKYLAGHGDVLGGIVVTTEANLPALRSLAKALGPLLGPFEAYLAMRGIKTFPLRMERQCANAARIACRLAAHPAVEKVNYPGDPNHPDAAAIKRLFAPGLYGAMVSFEIKGADREGVFRFMNALKLVVPGTSLGDVQTMVLYPVIASHRELSPKHRLRLGIHDNLVRLSVGIENVEDILADLEQALG